MQYLLSQVRQILGTDHWHNPVPFNLKRLTLLPCLCTPVDVIGNLVYVYGPMVGDEYQVRTADPAVITKMPVMGMVVQKDDIYHANVQYTGPVTGLSGLITGHRYFVGTGGQLALTPPAGDVYVQTIGVALDPTVLLLAPEPTYIHKLA